MGKKKLPPPPPSDDPVLMAIKEVHKHPTRVSPRHRRSEGIILRGPGARVELSLDGKRIVRWRKAHGAGAGLDRPPLAVECDRAQQRYETTLNKLARAGRWFSMQSEASAKGVAERRSRAVSKADVRAFAKHHSVKQTAKQFLITPRRVRQIRDEEKGK
jgi:hypothetical protein